MLPCLPEVPDCDPVFRRLLLGSLAEREETAARVAGDLLNLCCEMLELALRLPLADTGADAEEDGAAASVGAEGTAALPLPLRPRVDLVAKVREAWEEGTLAPTLDGVDRRGVKVEDGVAGDAPGEAGDLRVAEEGLEAKAETAVAGVTGAESWLVEENDVSLRESESSSVGAVAAESLRLLRSGVRMTLAATERRGELAAVEAAAASDVEAVAEASVERAPAEGTAGDRVKERTVAEELGLARLRSPGMEGANEMLDTVEYTRLVSSSNQTGSVSGIQRRDVGAGAQWAGRQLCWRSTRKACSTSAALRTGMEGRQAITEM